MLTKTEVLAEALILCDTLPIQTVARNIYEANPGMFKDVDTARSQLRYRRGAHGDKNRRDSRVTEPKLSTIAEGLAKLNRHEERREPVKKFSGCRALVLSDVHIPYHDVEALTAAIEYGKAQKCDVVILNGDIQDCYQVSDFSRDPGRMGFWKECSATKEFLTVLRKAFPDAQIVYKLGNHEIRLQRYLWTKAKELSDIPSLEWSELLGLKELGISLVKRQKIMLGKLNVLHGDEFGYGIHSPVNPARGVFLRTKTSTLVGHHHQISTHAEGDLNESRTACYSTGCLCNLKPEYSPFAFMKWGHGFAIVDVDAKGLFRVHNHEIIGGEIF